MSILSSEFLVNISPEDLYNCLYWDHRIYDLRSEKDYIFGHICRAHNLNPLTVTTVDEISHLDAQINDEYGRAEQPSEVIVYKDDDTHHDYKFQMDLLNYLISYLTSSNKSLKHINILIGGYNNFHSIFPFLCSDSIYYNECSQLVWPSYILDKLYLGSASCRNETVISMLGITHIISFSDYKEKKLKSNQIKTLHYQISDSLSATLLPIFPLAVEWISKAIDDDKGTVLVHCEQGVSRSSSVILAYLLNSTSNFPSVNVALDYLKSKRNIIRPNESFMQQLEQYWTSRTTRDDNLK